MELKWLSNADLVCLLANYNPASPTDNPSVNCNNTSELIIPTQLHKKHRSLANWKANIFFFSFLSYLLHFS